MVTRPGRQRDHEEDQVPLEPGQREHLDGEPIAGREAPSAPAGTSSRACAGSARERFAANSGSIP